MYQVYIIDKSAFDPKKMVGEFSDIENAHSRVEKELAKNNDAKYIIEQTTGHVNSYGDLVATVIEKN